MNRRRVLFLILLGVILTTLSDVIVENIGANLPSWLVPFVSWPTLVVIILLLIILSFFQTDSDLGKPSENKEKTTNDDLNEARQMSSGQLQQIANREDFEGVQEAPELAYLGLVSAYDKSEESINIISWKNLRSRVASEQGKLYFEATFERLRKPPTVLFRWLTWTIEHLEFVEELSEKFTDIPNSEIRFLTKPPDDEVPVLPCVIIDEKVVNFGWGYLGRPQMDEVNITLLRPDAVNAFVQYYSYLWQNSITIKEKGELINENRLIQAKRLCRMGLPTSIQATPKEAYQELVDAYQNSKESINIISWKDLRTQVDDVQKQRYFGTLIRRLNASPKVALRRLLWTREHLELLEEWAVDYDKISNVEFRFFLQGTGKETPIIPSVIVDERAVNFGWGYLGRAELDEVNITLRQPDAVKAFMEYYTYLWQQSYVIKAPGGPIDFAKVIKLRKMVS